MIPCAFCGQPEHIDLAEIWGHEFQLDTCCEGLHDQVVRGMADEPEWGRELLSRLGAGHHTGRPLRRLAITEDGCGQMLLDHELRIAPVDRPVAQAFVRQHHAHNTPLPSDRFTAGIWNGPTMLGVVVVGNPTTPSYNNRGWLEVRRLCLDRGIPQELRYKAASALYTWAAEEAERRGWSKILTYTLASETGMTLRYARWKCEGPASRAGKSWAMRGGGREEGPTEAKVRWSRMLRPAVPRMLQMTFALPPQRRPKRAA